MSYQTLLTYTEELLILAHRHEWLIESSRLSYFANYNFTKKKIIRFITFSPYLAHTKNLFLDTNILPFKRLVIHRIGIQMFKFNLGLSPVALNNLFVRNSNIHNYNTRNKNKLRSAIGRHKFIYKNFRYISVHIWNNITDKIDTDTSLLAFKKQLKVLLFTDEITIPLES